MWGWARSRVGGHPLSLDGHLPRHRTTLQPPPPSPHCHPQGRWLPEEQFSAPGRFTAVAATARAAQRTPGFQRPLAGRCVCVHCVGGAPATAAHRQSLQRLVRALGGRVVGPAGADVCVACGGVALPRTLRAGADSVGEEWLLAVAERYAWQAVSTYRLRKGGC